MELETLLWIVGVLLLPVIGGGFLMFIWIKELVDKHREPDKYGFGVGPLIVEADKILRVSKQQRDCLEEMLVLLRWNVDELAEKNGKKKPPPYVHLPK